MKPPYNSYDLEAVDRFSGETSSSRIRQVSHCIMLLRQGVEKGFGVFAQRKILARSICGDDKCPEIRKCVSNHVALASYILLDSQVLDAVAHTPDWSAVHIADYLETRFETFDMLKKFYGRSHRL